MMSTQIETSFGHQQWGAKPMALSGSSTIAIHEAEQGKFSASGIIPADTEKSASSEAAKPSSNDIEVKIGFIGDAQVGKTALMVKYVESKYDEDYIQTSGVNFMEKVVTIRDAEITFSIWDLGGHRSLMTMLPLVSNDAIALCFIFDTSRISTLLSIKDWYLQARKLNKSAHVFLVGTKYDVFTTLPTEEQEEIDKLSRRYSKAMNAPLIMTSASHSINVQKLFKILLAKVFDLKSTVPEIVSPGEPLVLYKFDR